MNAGDKVVATKDIGGFMRPSIPKGTSGVITVASWGELKVLFTVKGWMSDKQHEVNVDKNEIA
jgi:hypothetical protein